MILNWLPLAEYFNIIVYVLIIDQRDIITEIFQIAIKLFY
jgi:hypothetical protein